MTLDPYNAFLHRVEEDGDWRVAVKDVIDVAGMPTTAASKVLHRVPERDAECVARLRAAGATIVGKLNTHEFAFGALTNSPHFGPALNPWDPDADDRRLERRQRRGRRGRARRRRARHRHRRLGPDPGRVLRRHRSPADVRGSCRPTASSRPRGASTRSARSPAPPRSAGAPWRSWPDARSSRSREIRRVGLVTRLFEQADPGVAPVCAEAARVLAPDAEPVELPLHEEIATITQLVMLPEAAAVHLHWLRTKLADYGAGRPRQSPRRPAAALDRLRHRPPRTELGPRRCGSASWGTTTCSSRRRRRCVAPRLDAIPPTTGCSVMPYNSPASLLGLPVTNVPCGFVDGLPVGLSLTGRPGDDDLTLRAAEEFQRATDWHLRSPVDGAPGEVLYTTDTTE